MPDISVEPDFCILVVISFLVIPIPWVISWLIAAVIHELSHLLMIHFFRIQIRSVKLRAFGAVIRIDTMTHVQELFCTLSGPFGELLLLLLSRQVPRVAICALVQSVYNLIPIYPLDGGRILRSVIAIIANEKLAYVISQIVGIMTACVFLIACICLLLRYHLNFVYIIFPFLPLLLTVYKNSLQSDCKNSRILKKINAERVMQK